MDLQQLRYFCAVAKNEHMTKAAETLHISQPSLSTAIRRLEAELGVRLFDRKGRSIKLNAYGRAFLAKAEPALQLLDEGQRDLCAMSTNAENRITISTPSLYADPELMRHILQIHPRLEINQVHAASNQLEQLMQNGDLDFCITTLDLSREEFHWENLRDERVVLVASRANPIARHSELRLIDCRDQVFMTDIIGGSHRLLLDKCCLQAGFEPKVGYVGSSIGELIEGVSTSTCVALIPEQAIKSVYMGDLKFIRLVDPEFYITLKIFWPKKAERSIVASVRSILMEFFSRDADPAREYFYN